jgi:hypothetical protein
LRHVVERGRAGAGLEARADHRRADRPSRSTRSRSLPAPVLPRSQTTGAVDWARWRAPSSLTPERTRIAEQAFADGAPQFGQEFSRVGTCPQYQPGNARCKT